LPKTQPGQRTRILLVNGRSGRRWLESLQEAVSALGGTLETVDEGNTEAFDWEGYDLVILDAGILNDLLEVLRRVRSAGAATRVVVFSPVPDWKQAREVMLGGAIDYACKSSEREPILSTLKENLKKKASPWGR
jgi:DNA-binding NtrC family response regulator